MPRRISTVRGREFGAGVRAVLDRTGMSYRSVAGLVGWDFQKLSDLLNGKCGVNDVELARLLGVCRSSPEENEHLMALLHVAREKGWWQLHGGNLPIELRTFIEHLDAAISFYDWCMNIIPGLLQTPEYMRALIKVWPTIPPGEVEDRVSARLAMQKVLERERSFVFYIHEQALQLPVGGPEVMSEQLHHLLRMLVRPRIILRVVPTEVGAHAGTTGNFSLMKFAKLEPMVYVESLNSCQFLEDKPSIASYEAVLKSLDRTALDPEQSRRLITDLAA